MEHKYIKSLNFSLAPICFGGAALSSDGGGYGFGVVNDTLAEELLLKSVANGINCFDTAPIYGYGLSEIRIGKYLKNFREKIFVISKSGVDWHENRRVNMSNDPKITEKMLNESLKRLNFDYIDCYMIHWPDKNVDIRYTMQVLAQAKLKGKIKKIGLCNTNIQEISKALEIDSVDLIQSEVNFFNNSYNTQFIDYLNENGISYMSWGIFDKGILLDRVDKNRKYDKCDARSWAPWWKKQDLNKKIETVQKLKKVVEKFGINLLEFNLGHSFMDLNLIMAATGYKSIEQLESILKALNNLPNKKLINEVIASVNL